MLSQIENMSVVCMNRQKNNDKWRESPASSLLYIPINVATKAGKYKGYMRKIKIQSSKNSYSRFTIYYKCRQDMVTRKLTKLMESEHFK